MPPIADDDTPPPEQRPLIRQAVGFAQTVTAPANVDTYEARPATSSQKATTFLPGQEVVIPKKKKEPRSKKVKHSANFPNHVSRFRLESYDPTAGPSVVPPLQSGTGPYSSIYRASTTPFNPQDPVAPVNPAMPPAPAKKPRGKPKSPHPFTQPATFSVGAMPSPPPSSLPSSSDPSTGSGPSGHHYRRDYDKDPYGIGALTAANRRASSETAVSSAHASPPPSAGSSYTYPSVNGQANNTASGDNTKPRVPSRMVTILIIDIRSGTPDHQLAEVKIPLKPAELKEDGFWADARDLVRDCVLSFAPCH